MTLLRLMGGEVYDPAAGVHGEVRDLWVARGKMTAPPTDPNVRPTKTIDCRGCIVMPGGVDMHSHIAGPKVNLARKLRPEEARRAPPIPRRHGLRSGVGGSCPSSFAIGALYAGLGYTTVVDAAVPALFARDAHAQLADVPFLDTGFLTLAGNNHLALDAIRDGDLGRLDATLAWLVDSAKAHGLKLVNPGGIEAWKEQGRRRLVDLDERVAAFNVTPRDIVGRLAASADRLRLPHAVHIHCNNLGAPGNWRTTAATLEALGGARGHFAHLQFHSYAGDPADDGSIRSAVPELAELLAKRPEVSFDVGHIAFGPTTSLTGDGPLGYFLHRLTGNKWVSADSEAESGCGVVPIEYKHRSLVHGVQWAVGLEWYLLSPDLWRTALSCDHPNGGLFVNYPETIRLLMDRDYRRSQLEALHPLVRERTVLGDLDRELTVSEIAILTRAAPARILGLPHKGTLAPGADADICVYDRRTPVAESFGFPRYTIKAGEVVLDDGELRPATFGNRLFAETTPDESFANEIAARFREAYSIEIGNYAVREER